MKVLKVLRRRGRAIKLQGREQGWREDPSKGLNGLDLYNSSSFVVYIVFLDEPNDVS